MFKKWLAILGAVVLVACAVPLLWASGGGGGPVDEYPWGANNDGTGGTSSVTVQPPTSYPLTRIYIVRRAPMGGFYLVRISLSPNGSTKATAGAKKIGN